MSILREGTLAGHTDAVLCLSSQPSVAPTAANTSKRRGKGKGRQPQKKQCDTDCRTHTTLLCSGSDDGTLKLWDVHQHLLIDSVACSSSVTSVCFHPKESNRLFCSVDSKILEFDIRRLPSKVDGSESGDLHSESKILLEKSKNSEFSESADDINEIAMNASGRFLAVCDDNGEVRIHDVQRRQPFKTMRGFHDNICSSVQFQPKTSWSLCTGGMDCAVILSDFSRPRITHKCELLAAERKNASQLCNPPFVNRVSFSSSGEHFVAATGDYSAYVFHTKTFHRKTLYSHLAAVTQSIFYAKSESLVLTASDDRSMKLWNLENQPQPESKDQGESSSATEIRSEKGERNEGEQIYTQAEVTVDHGEKFNWLTWSESSSCRILAADTTPAISLYRIPE